MILARQRESFHTMIRHQHFEAFVMREIAKQACIVRIVFDDQQRRIVFVYVGSVVRNRFKWLLADIHGGQLQRGARYRSYAVFRTNAGRRARVRPWQVQRERTTLAENASQLTFSAQQAGQLAADGETQSRSTVFTAGAGIRLLKCLKDDSLLFGWDTDSSITDFESNHRGGFRKHRVVFAPP